MSARRASIAMTGPGCGGIRPCITERKESIGRTSRRNGRPVSFAKVITIGRMSSRPTANQVVMPTQSASRMMHRPMRPGPSTRMNSLASTPAPPDSARSLPNTTPRTMIAPVPAKVLPKPVWKALRTSAMVITPELATTIAPRVSELIRSAMNGLSFSQVTSPTRTAMARRAKSIGVNQALGGATVARVAPVLMPPSTSRVCPVTYRLSSEARKTTGPARSPAAPGRLSGMRSHRYSTHSFCS